MKQFEKYLMFSCLFGIWARVSATDWAIVLNASVGAMYGIMALYFIIKNE
jgi:hypothetical protein